jgi:hypothetical protein
MNFTIDAAARYIQMNLMVSKIRNSRLGLTLPLAFAFKPELFGSVNTVFLRPSISVGYAFKTS